MKGTGLGTITDDSGDFIEVKDVQHVIGTSKDDVLKATGVRNAFIEGKAGDDLIIVTGSTGGKIFGGAGDDIIYANQLGIEITGGAGKDFFEFSQGALVTDATGEDRLGFFGISVKTAIAWGGSEATWAYALGGIVKVGFNTDGEMVVGSDVIGNAPENYMYFAHGNRDPLADDADLTAGVRVGSIQLRVRKLLEPSLPSESNDTLWAFLQKVMKKFNDPLVLDLDGDGITLDGLSSASRKFDLNDTGFAVRTGWAGPGDGFLALDRNGDGLINDIGELFGNAQSSRVDADDLGPYQYAVGSGNTRQIMKFHHRRAKGRPVKMRARGKDGKMRVAVVAGEQGITHQ